MATNDGRGPATPSDLERRAFLKRMAGVGFAVPFVTTFSAFPSAVASAGGTGNNGKHVGDKHTTTTPPLTTTAPLTTTVALTTTTAGLTTTTGTLPVTTTTADPSSFTTTTGTLPVTTTTADPSAFTTTTATFATTTLALAGV